MSPPDQRQPNVSWDWSTALFGAVCALPAALTMTEDVTKGLALAVGVLPAVITGVPPTRKGRRVTAVLGAIVGVPILVGSVLAHVPVLAVAAMFVAGIGAVALAQRPNPRPGMVAMTLGLPMMGIGFSYGEGSTGFEIAILMVAGSVFAAVVSMAWPERPPTPTAEASARAPIRRDYGIRLGAAGATAAAIGFGFHLDHVGWACAAALLVMRPVAEMQRLRSVGRIASVAIGAAAAVAWLGTDPAAAAFGAAVVLVLAAAAGTHGSRWYITSAFTTFLVFLLLLHDAPQDAPSRFGERIGETILGVAIAYVFGLLLPALLDRRRAGSQADPAAI